MLASSQAPGQERVELRNDLTLAVDRANRWITELVRVSQVPQLVSEVVWLSCVMRECVQELTPKMTRRGIRCTPADDEAPAAHTAVLRQILVSLLANAIEAMPKGGESQLGWKEQGPNLQLHVLDIGTGLSGDARQALFAPSSAPKAVGWASGWCWSGAWWSNKRAALSWRPQRCAAPASKSRCRGPAWQRGSSTS